MEESKIRKLKLLWRQLFPTTRNTHKWLDELEGEHQRMVTALKEWAKESPKVAEAMRRAGIL